MGKKKKKIKSGLLFDVSGIRGASKGPDVGGDKKRADDSDGSAKRDAAQMAGQSAENPMTVSNVVAKIKSSVRGAFPKGFFVMGEISNLTCHGSGHMYFSIKDSASAIGAMMFKARASKLKFQPDNGMEVLIRARADVYEAQGRVQLYVDKMIPLGAGELELEFQRLCEKLRREGLFDESSKMPLPKFPRAVGVITSPTGAAVRDIVRTIRRRCRSVRIYLVGVLVQGDGSAEQIARAVRLLDANAEKYEIDTIIVSRGGGSIEDLWAFNSELVARAVYESSVPVISGVGHEVDITVCDLAADVRAATPTAAAELSVPDADELRTSINSLGQRCYHSLAMRISAGRSELEGMVRSVVFRDPQSLTRTNHQRVDELFGKMSASAKDALSSSRLLVERPDRILASFHPSRQCERLRTRLQKCADGLRWSLGGRTKLAADKLARMQTRLVSVRPSISLNMSRQKVAGLSRQLDSMSYRSVIRRGFSVTTGPDGKILRSAWNAEKDDTIVTELADGKIASTVRDIEKTVTQSDT